MSSVDVIVVGAGTAGLPCAITAAEASAKVVVVEKHTEVGGTLFVSAGQMSAAGTRQQRARGIEDTADAHFEDVMRIGHGKNDQAIVRLAVDEAAATINWLEEIGYPMPEEMPIQNPGHELYSADRTYWAAELGHAILNTLRPRFDDLVAAGRIDLLLEHKLTELVSEAGSVVGIRAEGPDGAVEVRGGATVLATGGYASNREMFNEFHPDVHGICGARPTSTGDGIEAARRLGAGFRGAENHLPTLGGIELEAGSGESDLWDALAAMNPAYRAPREIYVDASGNRVIAEDCPSRDMLEHALADAGGRLWLIFDEASIDDDDPLVTGWDSTMLRSFAEEGKKAWMADDLEVLAREAGIDAGGLVRSVEAWNGAITSGSDPVGREHLDGPIGTPPFYAVLTHALVVITFGGITVDGDLRVVDDQGVPIPGLYAAGEVLGASAAMGDAFCGGMSVTPSISFGRILGKRLAAARDTPAVAASA